MTANKKELYFLSAILVISFLCSFYSENGFALSDSINPMKDLKIVRAEKIITKSPETNNEQDFVFKGGFCYNFGTGARHSDFYQGNISQISSSPYWRFPISEIASSQILEFNRKGFTSQLVIPFDLSLPVISIICHPDDFFSYTDGIYVQGYDSDFISSSATYPTPWSHSANYYRKENDKRKIFFSYHDIKGISRFSSYANAEISGKATRSFPQKSLRLSAAKNFGNKKFKFDFFGNGDGLESLILRNGGNDNTKSLFRDMLMQELMDGSELLTSGFIPCEVFLNGEYWGIYFLQNRMDPNFVSEIFGCKEKNVTIVENWKLDSGDESEFGNLNSLMKDLEKSNFTILSETFDLDDLASYLVGQMFFANTDWPSNNLKMFRISGSKNSDSKWKFAFFDLDYGFGYTGMTSMDEDMFARLLGGDDPFCKLFQKLMEYSEFRKLLLEKFRKLLSENLSATNMDKKIGSLEKQISLSIERHTLRWRKPASPEEWRAEIGILQEFASGRGKVMENQIKKYLR